MEDYLVGKKPYSVGEVQSEETGKDRVITRWP